MTTLHKGIVLAGGSGTRLYPATRAISKQLLPVFDKPMVYYPLSVLMLAGIRDIVLISTPHDLPLFKQLLGTGSQWGISLTYREQPQPEGIAQALVIAGEVFPGSPLALILGDNVFYSHGLTGKLQAAAATPEQATIFGHAVPDPERFGVLEFASDGSVANIVEKPPVAPSEYAVTGLYFYPHDAPEVAAGLRKSARGEYEITDVNRAYLQRGQLHAELLGRGAAWLDTGTHEALLQAANFVATVQNNQRFMVACLEEIAFRAGWISKAEVQALAAELGNTAYARYVANLR